MLGAIISPHLSTKSNNNHSQLDMRQLDIFFMLIIRQVATVSPSHVVFNGEKEGDKIQINHYGKLNYRVVYLKVFASVLLQHSKRSIQMNL